MSFTDGSGVFRTICQHVRKSIQVNDIHIYMVCLPYQTISFQEGMFFQNLRVFANNLVKQFSIVLPIIWQFMPIIWRFKLQRNWFRACFAMRNPNRTSETWNNLCGFPQSSPSLTAKPLFLVIENRCFPAAQAKQITRYWDDHEWLRAASGSSDHIPDQQPLQPLGDRSAALHFGFMMFYVAIGL